jgi:N4-(beta-N-acetylglucosaminyl)-L-asparaginase
LQQRRNKDLKEIQIGFIALNKQGQYGAYCLQSGFNYAVYDIKDGNHLLDAAYYLKG